MNTFEQHIDRQIKKILLLDAGEGLPPSPRPLAIYFMFEGDTGLVISFGLQTTALNYISFKNLQDEYGTELGESCINELEPSNRLNKLIGQAIKSIKIGKFNTKKGVGENFIIEHNEYAGVIIQTTSDSIAFYSAKAQAQILFDTSELPQTEKNWTSK